MLNIITKVFEEQS